MKRGVMALVLLAGGLLLLGGLLASVDPGDLAPARLDAPRRAPEAAGGSDRLEEFVGVQGITLVDDVELEIPEGASLTWDGDTLQVLGNVTLRIPADTTFENLTIVLPEKTRLLPTEGSEAGRRILLLAPETRVRMPEEHDGRTMRLPEGGLLRDHMIPLREQERGLEQHDLVTRQFSLLETPRAILEEDWTLYLEGDAHAELTAFAPMLDQMLDKEHTYTNETLSLTSTQDPGNPLTNDPAPTGAALPDGPQAPPHWWAWITLAVVIAGVALYTGARQVPALLRRRPATHHAVVSLDDRVEGLPLATGASTPRSLHVRLVPRAEARNTQERVQEADTARVRIELTSHGLLYKGRLGQEPITLPVPGMPEGDHEITIRIKRSPLARAHRARIPLRVAPWDEQVARDYQGLLTAVRANLPGTPALTPRQCLELLERLGPVDLDDPKTIVKTFEETSYSPKTVDETTWVPFATRVRRMHHELTKKRDDKTKPHRPHPTTVGPATNVHGAHRPHPAR